VQRYLANEIILAEKNKKKQGSNSLRGQILEQRNKNWPGLAREVSEICGELEIPDINTHAILDSQIKKAVYSHHYNKMKDDLAKSKKMEKHKDEDFHEVQP
jgi:hypothetical protein